MRQQFFTRIAVSWFLLSLAACVDSDTVEGEDPSQAVMTASTENSVPDAELSKGKASIFVVPREARLLFW